MRHSTADRGDIRCSCRKLLAKRSGATIELKCPRCRQQVRIDLETLGNDEQELWLTPVGGKA